MSWLGDLGRMGATVFIWGMASLISLFALNTSFDVSIGVVFIILVAMSFAYASTRVIWGVASTPAASTPANADDVDKPKRAVRDSKAEILLALMDEDERESFKEALKHKILYEGARLSDEGELDIPTSVDALLQEERRYRQ